MSQYPNDIHPDYTFATAYDAAGEVVDYIGNWETAQTMANEGYRIVVHEGDASRTKEQYQALMDQELENALDCFGPTHRK